MGQPPAGVPVLAVSRNTLGYWEIEPRGTLILVPNALESDWLDQGERVGATKRPIDVIVQSRKSSHYINNQLVPALRKEGLIVKVQEGWIKDLVALFNQSVYLVRFS